MEWDYNAEPCSCCGSHNHWAQDCPHVYQEHYQPDYGPGGPQNYNQFNDGGNGHHRNADEEDKILELVKSLVKHVEELTQLLKDQQNINESLNQRIEQLTNQFNNFAEKEAIDNLVEDARSEVGSDSGEPLIPIQLGNFKTNNALLDVGLNVSVIPGYVYDMYKLGPLQQINDPIVLTKYLREKARGVIKGLTVRVGDFCYPEDFVVLDIEPYAEKEQPRVILGKPFLTNADAQICCGKGTVDMTYGGRKLSVDFLSHSFDYYFTNTYSWEIVTNTSYSRMCDNGPKESVNMIDRFKDDKIIKDKEVKSPWWLKLRIKKRKIKLENKPPKKETEPKKNPIKTRTGELLYSFDDVDYDNPDHMEAIWKDGWMLDDNYQRTHEFFTLNFAYKPP